MKKSNNNYTKYGVNFLKATNRKNSVKIDKPLSGISKTYVKYGVNFLKATNSKKIVRIDKPIPGLNQIKISKKEKAELGIKIPVDSYEYKTLLFFVRNDGLFFQAYIPKLRKYTKIYSDEKKLLSDTTKIITSRHYGDFFLPYPL